jgi:hypothetical protein
LSLESAITGTFWIGTFGQGDEFAVGALPFGCPGTPKVCHAGLILRVALERFAENEHRLAAQVDAARRRLGWGRGFRHDVVSGKKNRLSALVQAAIDSETYGLAGEAPIAEDIEGAPLFRLRFRAALRARNGKPIHCKS